MTTTPRCTLNGLLIDGDTPDANGTYWWFQTLDGWWETAPVRAAQSEISPQGEVITLARTNGRPLVLTCIAATLTPNATKLGKTECFRAISTMKDACRAVIAPVLLEVTDTLQTLHANVRRTGAMKYSFLGENHSVQFQVNLFAEDPNRYDVDDAPFD
jgi:hypothetical protein